MKILLVDDSRSVQHAILVQADEILVNQMPTSELVQLIRDSLDKRLKRAESDDELMHLDLTADRRTGHPSLLFREPIHQLHAPRHLRTTRVSQGAIDHGQRRRKQGYLIPMSTRTIARKSAPANHHRCTYQ